MSDNRCKLERFPDTLRSQVDRLLTEMVDTQNLNFSQIARFCTINGYPISSPAVKRYFKRNYNF